MAAALEIAGRVARGLAPRRLPLGETLGLRLAEEVVSGVDSPPFDKSLVDGFAVTSADRAATLRITELVTAGAVPTQAVAPGCTIRVMTGAPIPQGADAVVKWEDCTQIDDETIRSPADRAKAGACILRRGAAFQAGQVVLAAGKRLTALDIALLAEIGEAHVLVHPRPRVGVLATGDELGPAEGPLAAGQIRNSNGPMLVAAVATAGAEPLDLGVARDDPADLRAKIAAGLDQCDVLLVSGGVSAGVKDLAPGIFRELGVVEHFHQVRMKPGKPLWFGSRDAGARRVLVFGLPGNPVSTFVSFKLFVEPALEALAGGGPLAAKSGEGTYPITAPFSHRGKRPTFHPCRRAPGDVKSPRVELLDWKGSADIATLTKADGLAALREGDYELAPGDGVEVIWL
ncbi:MAG TPA: gephyrin-like molybdotransferase Glp [Lacipirellulaceae bacterium]|nr:gephyrin-like molybdotransferase Glp [Lacipirellulaceae bacterium]